MAEHLTLSPAWLEGLDHAQIGAAVLLLAAAAGHAPRGCLPDDDAVLCDAAGFGVQIRAWRRVKPVVLAGWRRVADPADASRALLLFPPLAEPGFVQAAPVLAPAPLSAEERRRERDRIKKRRQRARRRAAASGAEGDSPFLSPSAVSLSPGAVPPLSPPLSPSVSPSLSPGSVPPAGGESAENRGAAPVLARGHDAPAREMSPSGAGLSPSGAGLSPHAEGRLAGARVSDSPSSLSPGTTISTTTTGENLAGAGANARESKVVVVGGVSIAEMQDRAAAKIVGIFHDARRARWGEGVARPTSNDDKLRSIVRQWFAAGATEALLVDVIRFHVPRLGAPPNTLYAIKHSVAAAIEGAKRDAGQPGLALQVAGGGVTLTAGLAPYLDALLQSGIEVPALKSWFVPLELLPRDGGGVVLKAPTGFFRDQLGMRFKAQLDRVFGRDAWQIDVAGVKQRGMAG